MEGERDALLLQRRSGTPFYGIDAPVVTGSMLGGGALLIIFAIIFELHPFFSRSLSATLFYPFICMGISLFLGGCVMVFSSLVWKVSVAKTIIDRIRMNGSEKVLDVGCGHGLMLITAATRLTTGTGVGVDHWKSYDQANNSPQGVLSNARKVGVESKIRVETGDAKSLPFENASFDVVLSSFVLHNMTRVEERRQCLSEMLRVVKVGGRIAVLDIFHTKAYKEELESMGNVDVELSSCLPLFCLPTHYLIATKRQ